MLFGATRSRTPLAQLARLAVQRLLLEHLAEHDQERVEVERLGQVLRRARAHRLDRGRHLAERRHHDDRGRVLRAADLLDQLDPVHPRHLQVGDHDLRPEGLVLAERLERIGRGLDVVALVAQELRERGASVHLIIDHQDATGSSHAGPL